MTYTQVDGYNKDICAQARSDLRINGQWQSIRIVRDDQISTMVEKDGLSTQFHDRSCTPITKEAYEDLASADFPEIADANLRFARYCIQSVLRENECEPRASSVASHSRHNTVNFSLHTYAAGAHRQVLSRNRPCPYEKSFRKLQERLSHETALRVFKPREKKLTSLHGRCIIRQSNSTRAAPLFKLQGMFYPNCCGLSELATVHDHHDPSGFPLLNKEGPDFHRSCDGRVAVQAPNNTTVHPEHSWLDQPSDTHRDIIENRTSTGISMWTAAMQIGFIRRRAPSVRSGKWTISVDAHFESTVEGIVKGSNARERTTIVGLQVLKYGVKSRSTAEASNRIAATSRGKTRRPYLTTSSSVTFATTDPSFFESTGALNTSSGAGRWMCSLGDHWQGSVTMSALDDRGSSRNGVMERSTIARV
ncbi:hypothetical protein BKA93DRAFT_747775 [Sparassis latifolia]